MHFNVPEDTSLASFKFRASDMSYSIFGCTDQNITLYLSRGSPPVINPEGYTFPADYFLREKPALHKLEFRSDKYFKYLNLSSPMPGLYYAVAFLPYSNPQNEGITQEGLTPECHSYIDASIYVKNEHESVELIMFKTQIKASLDGTGNSIYKFFIDETVELILINFDISNICDTCNVVGRIHPYNIPSVNSTPVLSINNTIHNPSARIPVIDGIYYYLTLQLDDVESKADFSFSILPVSMKKTPKNFNNSLFLNAVPKTHYEVMKLPLPYKEYSLHKSRSADSFLFTYEMQPLKDGSVPIAVNISSTDFSVIRFRVDDGLDVGGSLQLVLAFKPRIVRNGRMIHREKEPKSHRIVACISNSDKRIPTFPNHCRYKDLLTLSPISLNTTNDNDSVLIPYPESGDWYFSFRLFCSECESCQECSCPVNYKECRGNCTSSQCLSKCDEADRECQKDCKCKDGCKEKECNSTVLFDVSSYPCVSNGCGPNGKCGFLVSEGFVYSSCICTNKYKGWDCTDGSDANSMGMIILELVLLVISNLPFLVTVYFAYKRKYYVEMVVYFCICVSSSLYHACDAGENIISFCIMRLNVLQFCDFYCALLAIWVTLIAIAHLPQPFTSIAHILGAILLGAGTTWDKTSMWVFLLPLIIGIVIIAARWGLKYYRTRTLIPSKRYLKIYVPCGLSVALVAVLSYSILQTQSNYKYVHSLWHTLMAITVVILLPKRNLFSVEPQFI
ncbi:PREDICTED: transmembrane protein 8A isoform X2 [Nicrophorus vespilloides]|nr:PREDICTED: transmembrane protein 8A isoform X2 [Nicrophorus vespilloides]